MRGQNFINAQYTQNQSLEISRVVQEGVLFNSFYELESVIKNSLPAEPIIILCSKYNLHYSLELTSGIGENVLKNTLAESSYYSKLTNINDDMISYTNFYKKYKHTTEYL